MKKIFFSYLFVFLGLLFLGGCFLSQDKDSNLQNKSEGKVLQHPTWVNLPQDKSQTDELYQGVELYSPSELHNLNETPPLGQELYQSTELYGTVVEVGENFINEPLLQSLCQFIMQCQPGIYNNINQCISLVINNIQSEGCTYNPATVVACNAELNSGNCESELPSCETVYICK